MVMICSGGLDSTVLYYFEKARGHDIIPINFYYGSKHNSIERLRARLIIPNLRELTIDLSFLNSSLLLSSLDAPPDGNYMDSTMRSTVVPFRNGIMLSYAIAIAESEHARSVLYGSHTGDHTIYPDCRPEFIYAMNEASTSGTYNGVQLEAPFKGMTKGGIVTLGAHLGIEHIMAQTWTCYLGKEIHCGKCGSCTERKEAFTIAGVKDQTEYKE